MIYGDISHNRSVPSYDPEASIFPLGENDTEVTETACPSRVAIGENDTEEAPSKSLSTEAIFTIAATSHSLILLSTLETYAAATAPEASIFPSGENDTEVTLPNSP